jgi:methyl-accepting chemotaxis protein
MGRLGLLHHHPRHRARQLRWAVPIVSLLLLGTLATLWIQYDVSNQAVGTEFFRAHKTISHTGELLLRGTLIGSVVVTILLSAIALRVFHLTHRIVRPVHTLHLALEELGAGDLGVRVALHRNDEFGEVGEALNRLVDEFATTFASVHLLVDRLVALTADKVRESNAETGETELQRIVDELDHKLAFFRVEPRHTIEDGH